MISTSLNAQSINMGSRTHFRLKAERTSLPGEARKGKLANPDSAYSVQLNLTESYAL
jgi:hypothetical protein